MDRADAELIDAFRSGDERALGELLQRHAPAIYRFGLRMCRDPEDAKDVVQETLLAAARGMRDFRGASSLTTWLYAVARSFCVKKRRGLRGAAAHASVSIDEAEALPSSEAAPDAAVAARELGAALEKAIAALEPSQREVLVLRDIEGLSAPETAEVLGVTVDAVKSRLHRARVDVRAALGPFVADEDRAPATAACPEIVGLFSRYLEGEIGESECADMQRHVASCRHCDAACRSLKRTLALCKTAAHGAVPEDVQERIRNAVRELARP